MVLSLLCSISINQKHTSTLLIRILWAQHILDLFKAGFEVTLESDCVGLINYFGEKIARGLVSKEDFKIRLEIEKDGSPYFLDLYYDDEGLFDGKGDEHYLIGYFN